MSTVKVPGVGPVDKRVVYGTVGVAGAYLAWRWWQASASTAPESSEVDAAAELGYDEGDYAAGTYVPPTVVDSTADVDLSGGSEVIDTDVEWSQTAVELLSGYGVDPVAAALAIGKYLRRQQLSSAQADIVTQVIGLMGYPPQSGHLTVITAPVGTPDDDDDDPLAAAKKAALAALEKRKAAALAAKRKASAPAGAKYITVKSGDTIGEIAADNRTTVTQLKKFTANKYIFTDKKPPKRRNKAGDWIYPGDRVRVR